MKILFKHTLYSIKKNPLQSFIMLISVMIVTACALLCLNISSIFRQTAELWEPLSYGNADYLISANADYTYKDEYGNIVPSSRQFDEIEEFFSAVGVGWLRYNGSDSFLETEDHTVRAKSFIVRDLDEINRISEARIVAETAPSETLNNAFVSIKFAQLTGLAPGDTFSVKGDEKSYFVRGVCDNYGLYYGGDVVRVIIEDPYSWAHSGSGTFGIYLPDGFGNEEFEALFYAEKNDGRLRAASLLTGPISSYIPMIDESVENSMKMITIAAAAIGAVMSVLLASSFTVIVRSRSEELIRFKTAGATPVQASVILFTESIAYSLIGGSLGLCVGRLLILYLENALHKTLLTSTIAVTPISYLWSLLIGIGIASLSSLIPAVRLGIKPIRELTGGKSKIARRPLWFIAVIGGAVSIAGIVWIALTEYETAPVFLLIAGLAILIPGLMPTIVYGISKLSEKFPSCLTLGLISAGRNHGVRSAAVVTTALIVFVSFGASVLSIVNYSSYSTYIRLTGDYSIDISSAKAGNDRYAIAEQVLDTLKGLPYVEDAAIIKDSGASIENTGTGNVLKNLRLYAVESSADLHFVAPDCPEELFEAFDSTPNAAIVSSALAFAYGMRPGNDIRIFVDSLFEADHSKEPFKIIGVDETVTGNDQMLIIKYSDFDEYGNLSVSVNADPVHFQELKSLLDTDVVTVMYRQDDFSAEGMDKIQVGNLLPTFLFIIYGIAAIGLINLLLISASGRRDEFAVYRMGGADMAKGALYIGAESLEIGVTTFAAGFLLASVVRLTAKGIGAIIGKYTFPVIFTVDALIFAAVGSAIYMVTNFVVNMVYFALSGYRTLSVRQG